MSAFRRFGASLCAAVVALSGHAFASEIALSGTVLGTDAKPLSGVTVSLALAKVSATTDASGAWSLAATPTGIASRAAVPVANGHLILKDGRLSVRFEGRDVSGRGLARATALPRSLTVAARAADVPDTLLYTWMGKVRLRDTISASQTGIVRKLDTTVNPSIVYGYLTDERDGQNYRTVKIGSQVWMAQNLNFAKSSGSNGADKGKCYNNSADSCAKHGRLYSWDVAMQGSSSSSSTLSPSGVLGLCPTDWHVPSDGEWTTLVNFVGDSAGAKLKSTAGWKSFEGASGNGTDIYGFRALPSGLIMGFSSSYNADLTGYWWSATLFDGLNAWFWSIDYYSAGANRKYAGIDPRSLRCVKD